MVTIHLHDTHIELVTKDENTGTLSTKECSPEELLNLLYSCNTGEINSGLLPKNCLEVKLSKGFKTVFIFIREGKFNIKCYDTIYNIQIPHCIFVFKIDIQNKRINKSYLVSVKTDKITDNTIIYRYPFSHVSTSTLSICWGSTHLPQIDNLKQLQGLPYLFFKSEINHDWYGGNNTSNLSLRDLLIALSKKELNVYDVLNPTGMTYREFVENVGTDE